MTEEAPGQWLKSWLPDADRDLYFNVHKRVIGKVRAEKSCPDVYSPKYKEARRAVRVILQQTYRPNISNSAWVRAATVRLCYKTDWVPSITARASRASEAGKPYRP